MRLSLPVFQELRRLIHDLCGLALPDDKLYLVEQRLQPLVHSSGCANFEGFASRLRGPEGLHLREPLIEAITTNETSFFRDSHPFDTLRDHILPWLAERIVQGRARKSGWRAGRIWSTAASTGQEPYSVAMILLEFVNSGRALGLRDCDFSILATDISSRVLATAREGRYSDREVQRGVPGDLLLRWFRRDGDDWIASDRLRRLVTFRRLNLVQPLVGLGQFDVIFCRNVLIYFDDDTRRQIADRLHQLLSPGGLLVLGSDENLYGVSTRFESLHLGETIVFRKRPDAAAGALLEK
jgi:chemotaxis protein methyltransferase CheR